MLAEARLKQLHDLAGTLSNEELIWSQGYLAGMLAAKGVAASSERGPSAMASTPKKLSIVYGTETGNSKNLATKFAQKAKLAGVVSKIIALDQYRKGGKSIGRNQHAWRRRTTRVSKKILRLRT